MIITQGFELGKGQLCLRHYDNLNEISSKLQNLLTSSLRKFYLRELVFFKRIMRYYIRYQNNIFLVQEPIIATLEI